MAILIVFGMFLAAVLYAQHAHYQFLQKSAKSVARDKEIQTLINTIGTLCEEFDDYKKRVDALTLKAGFKL